MATVIAILAQLLAMLLLAEGTHAQISDELLTSGEVQASDEPSLAPYARTGTYLGGGVFFAPEAFNTPSPVRDSHIVSGWIGYRFSPHFALELRVERVDDFHVEKTDLRLQIDGWSTTGNVKVFLMTGRFQPFFDFGVGAFVAELDHTHPRSDPRSFTNRDTNAVFRASSGFDLYISPCIALNLSASFVSLVGDLAYVKFGQLGGGLTFRF